MNQLKAQLGRLKVAVTAYICRPGQTEDAFQETKGKLEAELRNAFSDTDGEAWLNEERAKVWDEAAHRWDHLHDVREECRDNAKALRSKGDGT